MRVSPLWVVVVCHFLSAFGVLGMSPYFGSILQHSFGVRDPSWAGVFYVLPLFVMAVAGPLWGAFGDRFGKKLSVLRAQVGLALALGLCGLTRSPAAFAACLVLQGIFGGTFSASNALLAEYYHGPNLAKALSTLQYSARLSLFLAPSLLGLVVSEHNPLRAYSVLWLLPALSFIGMSLLLVPPPPAPDVVPASGPSAPEPPVVGLSFNFLMFIEFWFTWVTVTTFPYFVPYFSSLHTGLSDRLAGVYFGAPHVVYLLLAFVVIRRASIRGALELVAFAFALFTASMLLHLASANALVLFAGRVLMGVSLVFGFIYINELVGHAVKPASAGRAFGSIDTASKFAGVFAGLGASLSDKLLGLSGPFVSAAVLSAFFTLVLTRVALRTR